MLCAPLCPSSITSHPAPDGESGDRILHGERCGSVSPPAPATPLVVVRDAWPTLPADAWAATEPQPKSGFQHSTVSSKLCCVRGKIPRPERQYFEVEPAALLG